MILSCEVGSDRSCRSSYKSSNSHSQIRVFFILNAIVRPFVQDPVFRNSFKYRGALVTQNKKRLQLRYLLRLFNPRNG